jgi:hypothetical protein
MSKRKYPKKFLKRLQAVTNKRPRTVISHILKYGFITTEELQDKYGYEHPPRAARDVREHGIPLETFSVKNSAGRRIAAYRFADPAMSREGELRGRKAFPKEFKRKLIEVAGGKCGFCLEEYEPRYLQVDHRVPYEIAGDSLASERTLQKHMLLCGSCNRAKSWSCEHCPNWLEEKSIELCRSCYWASPESYKHIAVRAIRRIDIVWTEREVEVFEKLKDRAEETNKSMPDYVKAVIREHLEPVSRQKSFGRKR